jgi:hypothetical protein
VQAAVTITQVVGSHETFPLGIAPDVALWHVVPGGTVPSHISLPSMTPFPHVPLGADSSDPQLAMAAVMQSAKKVPSLKGLLIVA